MPDTKISALTAASAAAAANELAINEAGTSKKVTLTQVKTLMQTLGMPRVTRLSTQHQLASTTGTEVTDLSQTLEAGTYTFTYALIVRSATGTVGPMLGVNFTGTGAPRMHFRFADASTALTAEVHSMDDQGNKAFGFISGMASNTETTTAPDMGTTVGVASTGTDILCFIEGIIIVTGSGDLELWHSSETATNTSVEVGSSLVVVRTA
jgi:hypothetical protein